MKTMLMILATLVVTMVGGCATYGTDYPPGGYYYDVWGSDDGGGTAITEARAAGARNRATNQECIRDVPRVEGARSRATNLE